MKLNVYDLSGEVTGEVEVADAVFGAEVKTHLFWQVVRWQRAKQRAGTHAVKTRHFVTGTTAKVYRQKGTGRARHGSTKAPIYVGGGVAHGPQPRSYAFKLNKKVRAAALRSALSMKAAEGKLKVVENFELEQIKTKAALQALTALGAERALVIDGGNEKLSRSVRNAPAHKYLEAAGLNVYDLLKYDNVVLTRSALDAVQGRLAK